MANANNRNNDQNPKRYIGYPVYKEYRPPNVNEKDQNQFKQEQENKIIVNKELNTDSDEKTVKRSSVELHLKLSAGNSPRFPKRPLKKPKLPLTDNLWQKISTPPAFVAPPLPDSAPKAIEVPTQPVEPQLPRSDVQKPLR